MKTTLAVRCAPEGRMHHLLSDALPIGWRVEPFGPDGTRGVAPDGQSSVIVTRSDIPGHGDVEWCHASIAHVDRTPTYEELAALHGWVFRDGYAYQCFVPASSHVNIHEHALHLWGRADGQPVLPDFGAVLGSI